MQTQTYRETDGITKITFFFLHSGGLKMCKSSKSQDKCVHDHNPFPHYVLILESKWRQWR
jgi:hypothetical protein